MRAGRKRTHAIIAGLAAAAVAGCSTDVQQTLGLGKRAPDEFQVVRRAPLVLPPPDYTLRPPEPGAVGQQQDTAAQARQILTGDSAVGTVVGRQSEGERALLSQSRVRAEPDIRSRIVAENVELADLDDRTFLFILNFQKRQFQRQEPVIDPVAEAERLKTTGGVGSVVTVRTGSQPIAQR